VPQKAAPIRSPLRYPGGKAKALDRILEQFPKRFTDFREPFVGGGSVFVAVRQQLPDAIVWINDLNADLVAFWTTARDYLPALVQELRRIKDSATDGRKLYESLRFSAPLMDFERAVRFFVMNRITFSGTTDSGGYSNAAFQARFTHSSLDRLEMLEPVMQDVKITNLDYREVLNAPDDSTSSTFVFLDPPYFSATKSKLYGKQGDLHVGFDHAAFALELEKCAHQWLVTYDDSPTIREHFHFASLQTWELQYGMNNFRQANAAKGSELFLRNYDLEIAAPEELGLPLQT
jgi:DNA adenine methylase